THMRQNPGRTRYATTGKGTLSHLEVEVMNRYLKVQAQDQPYKSAEDALAAVASRKAEFFMANLPAAQAELDSGALKAFAVTFGGQIRFEHAKWGEAAKVLQQ